MDKLQSIFSTLLVLFLWPHLITSQSPACDANTYGKPQRSDCHNLFNKILAPQELQTRFFVEEQLRTEPDLTWPGVSNLFGPPIVQMPKYYAMNSCNFALLPYTNPLSRLTNPLGISSWGIIKSYGNVLLQECLDQGTAGGEIFIKSKMTVDPVLVMFMWATGAAFEAKLNQYESNPQFSPQLGALANPSSGAEADNSTTDGLANGTAIAAEPSAGLSNLTGTMARGSIDTS